MKNEALFIMTTKDVDLAWFPQKWQRIPAQRSLLATFGSFCITSLSLLVSLKSAAELNALFSLFPEQKKSGKLFIFLGKGLREYII